LGQRFFTNMKSSNPLHLKTYLLILLVATFGPLGNLLLGKGMKSLGRLAGLTPAELAHFVNFVLRSGTIWMGVGALMVFFVAYMLVLSWADYSYVQPASAMAYGTAALLGHFVLREAVSPLQWAGILVICLGVLVVGRTPPRTTEWT
jgi:hypothetical protein